MPIHPLYKSYTHPQPLSPKITILLLLCLAIQMSSCLQLHEQTSTVQSTIYNPNLYLKDLTLIQNTFKTDLLNIQATFAKLNTYLNNTNISSSSQVIKLQQSLAMESNALYNIQTYLNVPFALKSCECLNFTTKQRQQLQSQVNKVDAQIKLLLVRLYQNTSGNPYINPQCPGGNCPVVNQIKIQIAQLTNYATVMNDTLNSNCCNRTLYIFRDNLVGYSFWIYGNITLQQYQAQLLKRANGSKIATCPATLPFVNVTTNACFICPSHKPVYNLGLGKCVPPCQAKGLILDMTTHQCGYNTTCQIGYYFNYVTHKCQISFGTSSRCPLKTPYWNNTILSCQICPRDRPYFDVAIRACRACTQNQFYDPFNRVCYSQLLYPSVPCKNGTLFNSVTMKCQVVTVPSTNPTNSTNATSSTSPPPGASSSCPSSTPYLNPITLTCEVCPTSAPYLNPSTQVCSSCPANTQWNPSLLTCVPLVSVHNCTASQYWDPTLKKCINSPNCTAGQYYDNVKNRCVNLPSIGQTGFCPPSTPHWNPVLLACQKCPVSTPFFNNTNKVCQACPKNTAYVIATNICKLNITCAIGTKYDSATGTCQKVVCSSSKPIFDSVTGICVACPVGTTYDPTTKVCKVPKSLLAASSACPPSNPYWNPARLACEVCPLGQRKSPSTNQCVPGVSHFFALSFQHSLSAQLVNMFGH